MGGFFREQKWFLLQPLNGLHTFFSEDNRQVEPWQQSKKHLSGLMVLYNGVTVYCGCQKKIYRKI